MSVLINTPIKSLYQRNVTEIYHRGQLITTCNLFPCQVLFSKRTGFDPRVEVLFVAHSTNLPWFKQGTINIGIKSLKYRQKRKRGFGNYTLGAISADHKVRGLTFAADSSDRVLTKNWREKRAARVAKLRL